MTLMYMREVGFFDLEPEFNLSQIEIEYLKTGKMLWGIKSINTNLNVLNLIHGPGIYF